MNENILKYPLQNILIMLNVLTTYLQIMRMP